MEMSQEVVWAKAAAEGNAEAFGRIVQRFQNPVFRLCSRYLRGHEAEDLAQETFVRAFTHIKSFALDRPLLPWLLTIARNLSLDRLRKHRPEHNTEVVEAAADADHGDPEQATANREQIRFLQAALKELPEPQREAIVLFHLEGLAYADIAAALGVPIGTVMTWLHRGRAILRDALQPAPSMARARTEVSP
jgi:RNA polymerase sigma-70 factor (ECF subfamily)